MTQALGFFTPWIIYLLITFLHYFMPGRWVTGYVRDAETGELLRYRLNGRLVLIALVSCSGFWQVFWVGFLLTGCIRSDGIAWQVPLFLV